MPGTASYEQNDWLDDPRSTRPVNVFTVELVVRYMARLAALFDYDYDSAMIFLALLEASGREAFRGAPFRTTYAKLGSSLPVELSKPVSRQAIARSIGLSRETVRRKVAKLLDLGFLVEDSRGGVIITRGQTATPEFIGAQKRAVELVRQFLQDLGEFATPVAIDENSND